MRIQVAAPAKAAGKAHHVVRQSDPVMSTLKPNEKLVYEALCKSKTPLKAYDILHELYDSGLRAPMTIYRALDALSTKGYVNRIESLNAYTAVGFGRKERPRGFLICRDCSQVKELELDVSKVMDLFSPHQVNPGDVLIEAYGGCQQDCQK